MNYKVLVLFIFILLLISCHKTENDTGDKYYFTTKLSWYVKQLPEGTVLKQCDSTIYFNGLLKYETGGKVKIVYCPKISVNAPYGFSSEGTIYPSVDSIGNMTYPEYWSTYGYYFTGGKIENNGEVHFEMGANLYDRGYHQLISGTKGK
jgi:hypothetical protein